MTDPTKKINPVPQGKYVPANRFGDMIFTAGMTPRVKGKLLMSEKVVASEPIEKYKEAVRQATDNALTAAVNALDEREEIGKIIMLTVYVNAEEGYTKHARIGDMATDYLCEILGDKGVASRAAIGVHTLPGNSPVEIQIVAGISSNT